MWLMPFGRSIKHVHQVGVVMHAGFGWRKARIGPQAIRSRQRDTTQQLLHVTYRVISYCELEEILCITDKSSTLRLQATQRC